MNFIPKFSDTRQLYSKSIDASSLAIFRILFGTTMCANLAQYSTTDLSSRFISPTFFFSFSLFDFLYLKHLPAMGMYILFVVMGVSTICIALGLFYRIALVSFFLTYGYIFLLEKTFYNNHHYLFLLVTFLLIFVDAHRCFSLDALRKEKEEIKTVPHWHILILRAQIFIVYFYAGIAKLHKDWLSGKVVSTIYEYRIQYSMMANILPKDLIINFITYGGLAFDISIGFFLLFKPTRYFAFFLALIFHLMNKWLFDIGVFPYFMIATLVLFMNPDRPRQIWVKIRNCFKDESSNSSQSSVMKGKQTSQFIIIILGIYFIVQLLIPLRHWLYPGNVNWTYEGNRFSWRMFANFRKYRIRIFVKDPSLNRTYEVDPFKEFPNGRIDKAAIMPDMLIQYIHFIRKKMKEKGIDNPQIYVESYVSLNNRPFYVFINPQIDLAKQEYPLFSKATWIMPHPDSPGAVQKINKNGEFTIYYLNGNLKEVANYTNGKLSGMFRRYYEDGALQMEGYAENDRLAYYEIYDKKGKLLKILK